MSARISLMYKRSGGCDRFHTCSDCEALRTDPEDVRNFICAEHGDAGTLWNKNWMACKKWKKRGGMNAKTRSGNKYTQMAFRFSASGDVGF